MEARVCVRAESAWKETNIQASIIASGFNRGQRVWCSYIRSLPVRPGAGHMTGAVATFKRLTRSGSRCPASYLVSQRVRGQTDSSFNGVINRPSKDTDGIS